MHARRSIVAAALALTLACGAEAQDQGSAGTRWYDATPLLAGMRPTACQGGCSTAAGKAALARAAGAASLEDLTLYDLDLDLDLDNARFTLSESIWITANEPLREIVLRLYANVPRETERVRLVRGQCRGQTTCTVRREGPSTLVARLGRQARAGDRILVVLSLEGTLDRIDASRTNMMAQGLEGLSSLGAGDAGGDYGLLAIGDEIASLAGFYAVLARRVSGRWERRDSSTLGDLGPDAIGHVRARIVVPGNARVAASGVVSGEESVAPTARGGRARRAVRIAAPMVRDFSILASRQLSTIERRVNGVVVRSHFLERERAAGASVLDAAAGSLAVYERTFGAYPYKELDIVEAPLVGGAGGVEFSGLVTVASMFYRAPTAGGAGGGGGGAFDLLSRLMGGGLGGGGGGANAMSDMMSGMREFVTAHEVAHQYWHGLVGSDSREHPYVDESLAQWSALYYVEQRYGAERARRDGDQQVRGNYHMMRLMGMNDARVDQPVTAFSSPIAYAGVVYGKGPYMYPELRRAAGDAAFFQAIRAYVERYRFRLAPARGLVDLLAVGPRRARVRAIARRWLEESHGDEDLGRADLGQMLAGMTGGTVTPEMQQALQLLGQLGLGGGGGGLGGSGAAGAGSAPGGDAAALEQLIRALGGQAPQAPTPTPAQRPARPRARPRGH